MRKFVIGDIHGGFKALKEVINEINLTSTDRLIFLGDYVDGWSESPEVLDFLIELQKNSNCVFIKGNHDDLLLNYLKNKTYNDEWFKHGGESTINAYKKIDAQKIKHHISFLENLKDYYIDEENRLFIHAGFTNLKGVEFEFFKPLFYWDRTLWETALSLNPNLSIEDNLYPDRFKLYKEIYIGHTPVTRIYETVPVNKACVWNIDTGAAFKGPLTILNIETKEYWQSEPLNVLYPNEMGRN
ncbi:metallophosphoesterase family protein [Flavobacterium sp. N2270]|uniref:metallophosphoesterase family protein n=1 Tax=Flavobacterium sp. N2270 TaxID=2986831 RepID=UPI0022259A3F|nr:metallophosphoesterase family protein [Flavobacterium sp. N2270]